jgi:hypothetical protein
MQALHDLINVAEPAWPLVSDWIRESLRTIQVLPADPQKCREALAATQVTTRSPLGAVIYETGGIFVDHRWVRLLGSGHKLMKRSVPSWNAEHLNATLARQPPFLLVADDVIGGFFAINGGAFGPNRGDIYYFAPDTLEWESLQRGYSDFLRWLFAGDLAMFYADQRWPGWENEVGQLTGDEAILVYPFLSTESTPIAERHRSRVPIGELYRLFVSNAA